MSNELKTEKKAQVVSLLCEDYSIRSIERIFLLSLGMKLNELQQKKN